MAYYDDKLEQGLIYQDYITVQLMKLGWSVNQFVSRKYQCEFGESLSGIEIKNDDRMKDTGNMYVEVAEKASNGTFVKSGICREDNTTFYVIGDYNVFYVFVKHQLKYLCENYKKNNFKAVETETSRGILIPLKFFEEHKHFVVKKVVLKEAQCIK